MPGSLPESRAGTDDEDELEFGQEDEEGQEGEEEDDMEEMREEPEPEFDDDLFAAGEMQNVPFL